MIYAKESGVSIKMNFEKKSYHFKTESVEENEKSDWNLAPEKVFYFTYDSMKKEEYEERAFLI